MANENWREALERAALLRQRENNGMPSAAELLAKMARSGELDFLDETKEVKP